MCSVVLHGDCGEPQNYIEVICRLYRKDAAIQGATGLIHAVAETEKEKIAISVGPLSGRVTAKQINDAVQDALASGILEVHVLGWAFEANVGEVKSELEKRGKVKVELIMIRPDTLAELKATQPEMFFSPLALPDIEVRSRRTARRNSSASSSTAWRSLTASAAPLSTSTQTRVTSRRGTSMRITTATASWIARCSSTSRRRRTSRPRSRPRWTRTSSRSSWTSEPFPVRGYKRIAVKVVDVYGNESTVVQDLGKGAAHGLRCRSCRHLRRLPRAGQALSTSTGGRVKDGRRSSVRFLASAKDVQGGYPRRR